MRCPHCDGILSDDWVKKAGATLMGRASGASKARASKQMKAAAKVRWRGKKKKKKDLST
jgi:hypothetical protein